MLNIGDAGKRLDTMVASFKGLLENADYTTEEGVWLTYVIKIMDEILIKGDADTGKIFREINNPEGRHTKTFETAIKDVEGFLQGKEILFKKGN
jgi:hypothetical protein